MSDIVMSLPTISSRPLELVEVTSGLEFPEGPIAMADGSVLLVELKRQTLTRVLPNGGREIVAELGGGPNGAAIGPDGAVYICNNGGLKWRKTPEGFTATAGTPDWYRTGSIQRVDLATRNVTTLYEEAGGTPLTSPNDLVFDSKGGFWFTDMGKVTQQGRAHGSVCYAAIDGSSVKRVDIVMMSPNGIGLSPDERTLYVAETVTGRLWAYEIRGEGELAEPVGMIPGRLLVTMPGFQPMDSLAVQADGKVCVCTCISGGITTIDPDTGASVYVDIPGEPFVTNLCFGGADMRDMWITCSGNGILYRTRWESAGLMLAFNA